MKTILILLAIILLSSCRSLSDRNEQCIENMPIEVRQYVRSFIQEGEKRGHKIALKNLRVELVHKEIMHDGHRVSAQTNTLLHKINFDTSCKDWRNAPKATVFHELGHAILHLDHTEGKYDIMGKFGLQSDNRLTENSIDALFN